MTINDIIQYTSVHFTIYPRPYFLYVSMVLLSTVVLYSSLCITVVMLGYDWWLCMVINISVQYSGGLLLDIILLTQGYLLPVGKPFKYHVVALYL